MLDGKKVLFSGMQATGSLTLGNYLGALKNWVSIADEYETFYGVVDMHSITIRQDPAELRSRARTLLTLYIAAGLDPEKNCIYYQSHVSGHAELAWILNCFTYMGELNGKVGAKIMSLQDPSKKMSKSDENPNASIYLMDDPDTIMRKFKRAVTDSEACVRYCDEQPGIHNLIDIYCACTGKTPAETEREFDGKGYGDFKAAVGESVVDVLKPLQDRFADLSKNKDYLNGIIKNNAEKAQYFSNKTLRKVYKKIGFVPAK